MSVVVDRTLYLFPPISEAWVDRDAQGFVNDVVYAAIYSGDSQLQRLMKKGALNDLSVINSALQGDLNESIDAFLSAYPGLKAAAVRDLLVTKASAVVKISGTLELTSSDGRTLVNSLVLAELPLN